MTKGKIYSKKEGTNLHADVSKKKKNMQMMESLHGRNDEIDFELFYIHYFFKICYINPLMSATLGF